MSERATTLVNSPNRYYSWLTNMIDLRSHRGYSHLISLLFDTEYYWLVKKDENRAMDAQDLRFEWIMSARNPGNDEWVDSPCSVLEVLVALARRIRVEIMPDYDIETADWFWKFISNMSLDQYDDAHFNEEKVCEKVCCFLENGEKNTPFPLKSTNFSEKIAKKDVDLWMKMQFWIGENYDF